MAHESIRGTDRRQGDWIGLIQAEYLEIPGLHLTMAQARRLWGLDDVTSSALFAALVEAKFLRQTRNGGYIRAAAAVEPFPGEPVWATSRLAVLPS
jgi:hypothetical protein